MKLKALHNKILCHYIEKGQQTLASGIILTNDDAREAGIRPRWMQVYAVGPEVKDIQAGQWVMVEHGRWTHGMTVRNDETGKDMTFWGAEEEAVLLVSDTEPTIERSASSAN